MKQNISRRTLIVYILLSMVALLSMTVSNVSFDAEYQLAMAYRFIKGDKMILQMWEPHQTSAFLNAVFMKLYMMATGTTTGIVLFMQVVGLLIRGGIATVLYRVVEKMSGAYPAFAVAIIYLLISPKELMLPEFGNMQLWCGTLLFLTLVSYWKSKKVYLLIMAAVWLCMGVFSYPSFIVVYAAVAGLMWTYADHKWKAIGIFTATCAVIGIGFIGYLLGVADVSVLLECISRALSVEPSHTVSLGGKVLAHVLNLGKVSGMILGVFVLGCGAWFVVCKLTRRAFAFGQGIVCSWYLLMIFLFFNILSVKNRGGYAIPFVVILLIGFWNRKRLNMEEQQFYKTALAISLFSLLATLVLSDNAFIQAITYTLIAICASVLPIYRRIYSIYENGGDIPFIKWGIHLFFGLIVFRCIYIHIPIYERDQIYAITDDIALIRSGPAAGIIAEEDGAARQRDSFREWDEYIREGDTIWILGHPVDTLGYLYQGVEVGAPTVMSTPTYTEALLYYYELNPEKYPDVIVMEAAFGELSWELLRNDWLMHWIDNEYQAEEVIDGTYWRYYIKRRD